MLELNLNPTKGNASGRVFPHNGESLVPPSYYLIHSSQAISAFRQF